MVKIIYWEMCMIMNYDYTDKWYMDRQEFVLENKMYKILWFWDNPIHKTSSSLNRKRTCEIVDFFILSEQNSKKAKN